MKALIYCLTMGCIGLAQSDTALADRSQSQSIKTVKSVRLIHKKELLGHNIKVTDENLIRNSAPLMRGFLFQTIQTSLPKKDQHMATRLTETIMRLANKYEMDPLFLLSIIKTESQFRPDVRGHHGEYGLMQVLPQTAKWISKKYKIEWKGDTHLFDPCYNVEIGAAYFDYLRKKFNGKSRLYISAYNMGPLNVRRLIKKNVYPRIYASKAMKHYLNLNKNLNAQNIDAKANSGQRQVASSDF